MAKPERRTFFLMGFFISGLCVSPTVNFELKPIRNTGNGTCCCDTRGFYFLGTWPLTAKCNRLPPKKIFMTVVSTFRANWFQAKRHCESRGMRLKSFINDEEQEYMYQRLRRTRCTCAATPGTSTTPLATISTCIPQNPTTPLTTPSTNTPHTETTTGTPFSIKRIRSAPINDCTYENPCKMWWWWWWCPVTSDPCKNPTPVNTSTTTTPTVETTITMTSPRKRSSTTTQTTETTYCNLEKPCDMWWWWWWCPVTPDPCITTTPVTMPTTETPTVETTIKTTMTTQSKTSSATTQGTATTAKEVICNEDNDQDLTEETTIKRGSFWTGYECIDFLTKPGDVPEQAWDSIDGRSFPQTFWDNRARHSPSRSLVYGVGSIVYESCVEFLFEETEETNFFGYNDADCFMENYFMCEKQYSLSSLK